MVDSIRSVSFNLLQRCINLDEYDEGLSNWLKGCRVPSTLSNVLATVDLATHFSAYNNDKSIVDYLDDFARLDVEHNQLKTCLLPNREEDYKFTCRTREIGPDCPDGFLFVHNFISEAGELSVECIGII